MTYTEDDIPQEEKHIPEVPIEFSLQNYSYVQPAKGVDGTYMLHVKQGEEIIGLIRLSNPKALRLIRKLFSKEVQEHARSQ